MASSFKQLHLGDMEHGLAKPIAVLALEPEEITEKVGVKFEVTKDDLDYMEAALIQSPSKRQYALLRHHHAPSPGTDILTNEKSRRLAHDLEEVLDILGLTELDLKWIIPDIK